MDQKQPPVGSVFLSASVPDPKRKQVYWQHLDVVAIREAVCAIVEVVLRETTLVFGGHPAISPLVLSTAAQQGTLDRVFIYQSMVFQRIVSPASLMFPNLIWTPVIRDDQDASVDRMRDEMLDPALRYRAGFFIAGMEGVERELDLFRKRYPAAPFWPIASTGGAARLILENNFSDVVSQSRLPVEDLLRNERAYRHVMRELLAASPP